MKDTLVSILLPIYNSERYLRAAMLSIMSQTYSRLEILAIDDGSNDTSLRIAEECAQRDARIKVIANGHKGLVATLNDGLRLATGSLIARMDADDIAYPTRIAMQVECFRQWPDLCVCGTDVDFLVTARRILARDRQNVSEAEIRVESIFHGFFVHPTVMYNNDIVQRHNLRYSDAYPHCEDFDLFRRIVREFRAHFINRKGLAWRQHDSSVRSKHFVMQCESHYRIVDEQLHHFGITNLGGLFAQWSRPDFIATDEHRAQLSQLLFAIWSFPRFTGLERAAYERGFSLLLRHFPRAVTRDGGTTTILTTIRKAGFGSRISTRDRLLVLLARIVAQRRALEWADRVVRAGQVVRSAPLDGKRQLPSHVVSELH